MQVQDSDFQFGISMHVHALSRVCLSGLRASTRILSHLRSFLVAKRFPLSAVRGRGGAAGRPTRRPRLDPGRAGDGLQTVASRQRDPQTEGLPQSLRFGTTAGKRYESTHAVF